MAEKRQHIVMLPFVAQGHFIPFVSLARLIEQLKPDCAITIATTPLNVQSLRSSLPSTSSIHVASLPFSSADHGLPPNTENSSCISQIDYLPLLMLASETLATHFDHLLDELTALHSQPPLFIIADIFAAWSLPISRARGIPHFSFATGGGLGTAAFMSLWINLPHRLTDADTYPIPGFPDSFRISRSQMSRNLLAADGSDDWSIFLRREFRYSLLSDGLLCNTVEEIEHQGVNLLRLVFKLPVFAVGTCRKPGNELNHCTKWLESHRAASVIFVSFGSQNTIGAAQIMALAEGLEASGVPFIWVVRPPSGFDMNGEFRAEWFPVGFEARMREKNRGLVVRRWAPQIEILSHRSTGAFLSHCGWNSLMESLSSGVPVIAWPVASEQFYNSMMMEEMGVGVEMARGVVGEVDGGKVERVLRMMMEAEKGREMRQKAVRCREIISAAMEVDEKKGSSVKAIHEVFEAAMSASYKSRD